jgi:hypothetical protein
VVVWPLRRRRKRKSAPTPDSAFRPVTLDAPHPYPSSIEEEGNPGPQANAIQRPAAAPSTQTRIVA